MAATQMQLEDWLDDLCVRFIINLPQEDLSSVARICFQVEEAQWFYEDFIRPLDPTLPSMSLRTFCLRIFQHCPLLASFSVENHTKAFEEFLQYKTRIPVRGAIMLNHSMDSVVLVKGWKKGANWSFPRGKINKDEDDVDCAVREVYEETGLDLQAAGLIPTEKKPKYIEILMREQQLRLYVFRDIPMDTNFQPRTRKEISKIQWYKLSELPAFRKKGAQNQNDSAGPAVNKFYMVAPFLVPLKKWIHSQKKMDEKKVAAGAQHLYVNNYILDDVATTEDDGWGPSHTGPPSHVPAIDTLDGATRELQRLLKMQPPTQGLQSPQQEDKGSALLSILQSSSSRSAESAHPHSQQPRTPLDAILAGPSQPQNPHHHNNLHSVPTHTQMPPPSFSLSADPKAAVWNQIGDPRNAPQRIQPGFDGILSQQQDGSQPVPLHTQQMSQAGQTGLRNGIQEAGQSAQQVHIPHGQPQNFGSDQHQTIMQSSQHPSGQRPASLSGQSLALLNAFKRDSGAARSTPPTQRGGPQSVDYQQPSGASAPSYASQNRSDNPSHFLGGHARLPSEQTNVSELVGSSVHAPKDQHRSALLGMFKKGSEDTAGSTTAENKLLQQLQSHGPANPHLSMEQLSIQPPATQGLMSMASQGRDSSTVHQQHYTPHHTASKSPFSTSTVQQQPPRILQRGQGFDEFNAGGHGSSPQTSPFPSQSGHVLSAPAPNASGEPNRRPDGSRQQKQQLLSLFGKQNSPAGVSPAAGMDRHESSEYGKSRVSSMASRGGETPISPAEQTFLLDYLQSVTNNAGR